MGSVLDEVAAAADEVADSQRRVARRARTMQRRRDSGWSWARILDWEPEPGILELSRHSARRLSDAVGRLAQALASGLSAEGESRRQIGRRLTVSHQRVTAMLKGNGLKGHGLKGNRREPDHDGPSLAKR
jgi:hypothetical protein